MTTVTDVTKKNISVDFNNSEFYSRYYSKMADKHRKRYIYIRFFILALVLAEALVVIPFMSSIPQPFGVVLTGFLGVCVICLTAFEMTSNDATNTAKLVVASDDCRVLTSEWRDLWLDIESGKIEEDAARERQRTLTFRTNLAGIRVDISEDKARSQEAAKEANQIMDSQYATTT